MVAKSKTILLVEDEQIVRETLGMIFTKHGFALYEAVDGVEGLKVFEEHSDSIDVVLMDLTMPRMNGLEASQKICELKPDARIILCSGYGIEDAQEKFAHCPFAAYVKKPFKINALVEKIESLCDE
ncbi:MAG: response regulator [Planctomycetota bacterium]|nr:response regulator [Planctomycetota bacterium]